MTEPDQAEPARPAAGQPPAAQRRPVSLRRAPRYRAFVGTGAVAGAVLAVLLTVLLPDHGRGSTASVLGYLGTTLVLVGALLGGAAAVLLERRR